jgi:hypothetical protein
MSVDIFILLITFQFKHLIADYYLQFPYMYQNKGRDTGWFEPLLDHSTIHALMTLIILSIFCTYTEKINLLWYVPVFFLFDLVTHFTTDRIKAIQPGGPDTKQFWINLGWDQMVHHTVGLIIVYYFSKLAA